MVTSYQAIVDNPELYQSVGITGSGSSLSDPCLLYDFRVDLASEVMGTQVSRSGSHSAAVRTALGLPRGRTDDKSMSHHNKKCSD